MWLAGWARRRSMQRPVKLMLLFAVVVLLLILAAGCATSEDIVTEGGFTYRIQRKTFAWIIPINTKKEQIEITDEDFDKMMARKEAAHAMELRQKEAEYTAAINEKIKTQKLREKMICTWILGACLVAAAACVIAGYLTRQWKWFGGLSLVLCGVAAGAAIFGDILYWIHSVSGFAIWVAVAGISLWLFRKFSLWEWLKGKFKRDIPEGEGNGQ